MDDPPLRGDRQEQTMEEMIRTQKGAVTGQRPDTPMGRSYKGHGKEDEKDDMDPHQHWERGDNVGKKTDQHPIAEENQSESDWKGRKSPKDEERKHYSAISIRPKMGCELRTKLRKTEKWHKQRREAVLLKPKPTDLEKKYFRKDEIRQS